MSDDGPGHWLDAARLRLRAVDAQLGALIHLVDCEQTAAVLEQCQGGTGDALDSIEMAEERLEEYVRAEEVSES